MKFFFIPALIIFISIVSACNPAQTQKEKQDPVAVPVKADHEVVFDTKPKDIVKDFNTWYNYTYYNIKLSQDFIGLDKDSVAMDKEAFLTQLQTGNYLAVKVKEKQSQPYYQLYRFKNSNKNISNTIKQMADAELELYSRVGKEFPAFNWTDLKGNTYNNVATKGKIVVVKCWFINCVACVKEFPELNQLVENYKNRKDIVFVSLAIDSAQELNEFLGKREFKYAVVPNGQQYMDNVLKITAYPTHIIIGKDGKIVSAVSNSTDLVDALKKEVAKG